MPQHPVALTCCSYDVHWLEAWHGGRPHGADAPIAEGTRWSVPPQMLLSPSVAFVRTILLEEMAKGLDSASRLAADAALQRLRDNLAAFGVRTPSVWDLTGQAVPPLGVQPGPRLPLGPDSEGYEQTQRCGVRRGPDRGWRLTEAVGSGAGLCA